jgi:hypothetical protein
MRYELYKDIYVCLFTIKHEYYNIYILILLILLYSTINIYKYYYSRGW